MNLSTVIQKNNEKYFNHKQMVLFKDTFCNKDIPFPPKENTKFTFIDLFAGIGGMRIAFQNLGGKCIFSSEIDEQAQKTYEINLK